MKAQRLKHSQTCTLCFRRISRGETAYRPQDYINVWFCSGCYAKHQCQKCGHEAHVGERCQDRVAEDPPTVDPLLWAAHPTEGFRRFQVYCGCPVSLSPRQPLQGGRS